MFDNVKRARWNSLSYTTHAMNESTFHVKSTLNNLNYYFNRLPLIPSELCIYLIHFQNCEKIPASKSRIRTWTSPYLSGGKPYQLGHRDFDSIPHNSNAPILNYLNYSPILTIICTNAFICTNTVVLIVLSKNNIFANSRHRCTPTTRKIDSKLRVQRVACLFSYEIKLII